jgi:hypothetical protein
MSLVNVAQSGATLTKVGGCSGCPDGTAISNQQVSGSGVLQFSTDDNSSLRMIGLGSGGIGTTPGDVNFAIRLQAGVAEVRESGAYKTETRFAAGDSFTIAVNNGAVSYAKNGSVFYTSANRATTALRGHAIFFDPNGTVRNVGFGGGGATAATSPAPAGTASPSPTETAVSAEDLSRLALEYAERLAKVFRHQ